MRYPLTSIFSMVVSLTISGQSMQKGIVQEYNGPAANRPLAGVEIRIKKANSTVSDKDGKFTLRFNDLSSGDRVEVLSLEKKGYELFNKSEIEQWNINPNIPHLIVMRNIAKRKKEEEVLYTNYNKRRAEDVAKIKRLVAENRSKDDTIRMLRDSIDQLPGRLDGFIDYIVRIDLSTLAQEELELMQLVKEGKIQEALSGYERQNYVDHYIRERAILDNLQKKENQPSELLAEKKALVSALSKSINNEINLLQLVGGKENVKKINTIYNIILANDPTDVTFLLQHGIFLNEYLLAHDAALKEFHKVLETETDPYTKSMAMKHIGKVYYDMRDYRSAVNYFKEAMETLIKSDGNYYMDKAKILSNMGEAYRAIHDNENSYKALSEAGAMYEAMPYYRDSNYAGFLNNFGGWHDTNGQYDKAIEYYNKAKEQLNPLSPLYVKILNNIGLAYYHKGDLTAAITSYRDALAKGRNIYGNLNPHIASYLANLGTAYNRLGQYDEAIKCADDEINIRFNYQETHPDIDALAYAYMRGGDASNKKGDKKAAREYFKKALDLRLRLRREKTEVPYNDKWIESLTNTLLN